MDFPNVRNWGETGRASFRHSRDGGNPALQKRTVPVAMPRFCLRWVPAFAGMTSEGVTVFQGRACFSRYGPHRSHDTRADCA